VKKTELKKRGLIRPPLKWRYMLFWRPWMGIHRMNGLIAKSWE
jgi:hypothetical protein